MHAEPVFVFGSTLNGQHDKGMAAVAMKHYGAQAGKGSGAAGNSYAVPVWNSEGKLLPLSVIGNYADSLFSHARKHGEQIFQVMRLGCDEGDYPDSEVAELFRKAPGNCQLSGLWQRCHNPRATVRLVLLDPAVLLKQAVVQRLVDDYFAVNAPLWSAPIEIVSVGPAASIVANDAYARSRKYLHRIIGESREHFGTDAPVMRDLKAVWYATHLLCLSDPSSTANRMQVRLISAASRGGLSVDDISVE
jgi:hypothetical protein